MLTLSGGLCVLKRDPGITCTVVPNSFSKGARHEFKPCSRQVKWRRVEGWLIIQFNKQLQIHLARPISIVWKQAPPQSLSPTQSWGVKSLTLVEPTLQSLYMVFDKSYLTDGRYYPSTSAVDRMYLKDTVCDEKVKEVDNFVNSQAIHELYWKDKVELEKRVSNFLPSAFGSMKECVKRRVMKSMSGNPNCSESASRDAMEAIWDVCYNDTKPFDRAP
ncbi:hypothetical protein KY289_000490 [Solanum tuberosum]|nr:hypothetical protein KY289_000490 [Solanum tuberosum]